MISEKNILQTDFEGRKSLARKYRTKKNPGLKKVSLVAYNPVKNLTLLYSA